MAPEIKFCGLTRPEDAAVAAASGARYAGVIFATGPRVVAPDRARDVFEGLGADPVRPILRVGVFGSGPAERIAAVAQQVRLDVIQLHGEATAALVADIRRRFHGRIWAVVKVEPDGRLVGNVSLATLVDAVLVDTRVDGALGGTGRSFDWAAAALNIRRLPGPLVLAGGLTPTNVTTAILALAPAVVDVSSGVERAPGVKDHALMRAFADAVAGTEVRA